MSAADRWIEVRSPNFTLVSNASEATARRCAWQFEQMRSALSRLWPWARFGSASTVLVAAARDESTLRQLVPQYWEEKGGVRPVSVWAQGPDRQYLALRTDSRPRDDLNVNPYFNVFRAYVVVVLSASLPRPFPLWLTEALGEFYGNLAVRDDDIVVGRAIPWHLEELRRGQRLRLSELLSADQASPLYTRADRRRLLAAEAWAFFHFLNHAEKGRYVPRLRRYVTLSTQGPEAAAREALGELGALESRYWRYFDGPTLAYGQLQLQAGVERERFPTRPLSAGEVAVTQASIHAAMGRPLDAAAQVEAARKAEPDGVATFHAEGLLHDLRQDEEKARAAYARAAELGSSNAYTYYRLAQLDWRRGAEDETWRRIAGSLERAIALEPDSARARSYLAEVRVRLRQAAEAEPLARTAVELEPGRAYHRVALARALEALGRRDEALVEALRGLSLARSERDRAHAQELIDSLSSQPEP